MATWALTIKIGIPINQRDLFTKLLEVFKKWNNLSSFCIGENNSNNKIFLYISDLALYKISKVRYYTSPPPTHTRISNLNTLNLKEVMR